METFNNKYKLPYQNPELEPIINLAKDMADQSININNSLNQILSDLFSKDFQDSSKEIKSTDNISLYADTINYSFDAAIKAREAELASLETALATAENILARQQEHILALTDNIQLLKQKEQQVKRQLAAEQIETLSYSHSLQEITEKLSLRQRQLDICNIKSAENQANIAFIQNQINCANDKINQLKEKYQYIQEQMECINNDQAPAELVEETKSSRWYKRKRKRKNQQLSEDDDESPVKKRTIVWSYVKVILIALLLAFFIRAYVFDITKVDGLSMYPTLEDNDSLITSKITYLFSEPQRGDIVVFDAPDTAGEDYVKRIIGLPNEEITIDRGMVYINGTLLDEPYLEGIYTEGEIKTVIPDGFYFVMGDNREVSRDSRVSDVGLISIDQIHGKVAFRILPFSRFGSPYNYD